MEKTLQYFGIKKPKNGLKLLLIFLFLVSSFSYAQVTAVRSIDVGEDLACGKLIDVELNLTGYGNASTPLEVILVIDVSGSMATGTRIEDATDAASTFVTNFLTDSNRHPDSKIGVVKFSSSASLVQGLSNNLNDFGGNFWNSGYYGNFRANGNTNMEDGIEKAVAAFSNSTNCALTRTIIFLSDGQANRDNGNGDPSTRAIQEALAAQSLANIYTIGFSTNSTAVNTLTEMQNSGFYAGVNATDLNNIYAAIFAQLSWVAKAPSSGVFNVEKIESDFELVNSSISVTKGSFVVNNAGEIEWDVDYLQDQENIVLSYQLISNGVCGTSEIEVSTSELNFLDTSCNPIQQFPTPTKKIIPCAEDQIVTICQGGTSGEFNSNIICPTAGEKTDLTLETYAGTGVNSGSGDSWGNPNNIGSDDGQTASLAYQSGDSKNLKATNFNFSSIPSDATIEGITVIVNRWASSSYGSNGVKDTEMRLLKSGSAVGNDKKKTSVWGTDSSSLVTYGGATDTWGTSWTVAEVKNNNFGATLEVNINGDRSAHVDYIKIKIDYSLVTVAGNLEWFTVESGGSSIHTGSNFSPITDANLDTNVPGTYKYYAGCSNIPGCRKLYQFIVNPLPTPVDASFTICSDETSTDLTAHDTAVLDSEIGTVAWYDGDPEGSGTLISSATNVNLNTITDLWAEVTLTSSLCKAAVDITVNINDVPVITNPGPQTACVSFDLDNLPITGTNLTNNKAYYNNSQSLGGTKITSPITSSQTVWIYDADGSCSDEESFTVTINALDDASFSYSGSPYCADATDPAPIITGLSGGTFSSTAGLVINANTGEVDLDASTPGTYNVMYTTSGTCPNSSTQSITINDLPTVSVSGAGELTCAVTSLTLTAVPVVDGTPSYQWYNASGAITGATSATYSAETPDTYYVIVKDGDDGCTVTSSNLEVTQDITDPTVSVSGAGELTCAVTSLTLTAVPVVDGTPSYQWYNASGAITGATSATYSAETPDTYYVIVKDGDDGCTVTSSNLEVTQDITDPTVSVSGAGELTCAVTSLTLTAVPVVDGTPSYQWYNASGAITGATSATYSAETPDTYYVIVKDGDDGCTVTSSNLEVTQDITDPTVSVSGAGELTCAVTSLTLTAVPVVDGTPSYQWYNASGAITGATSATYSAETPDTYYVIVKDGDDGCTVTSSNLEVTQDITDPTVSVSGAGELTCAVTSLTLTAVPVVDGTPSYQWYNASGAITGATSATYSAETPDTYYVIVKDGDDGCTVTSSNLEVTQDITDPTVSVSGAGELTCAVTSLTLTAVPVVDGTPSYQWYNASGAITGATSATYSAETPDTYYVIVKDGDDGCTVTSSNLEVTQDITDPTVSVSGAGELTCAVTSLTLTAVPVVDGTPSYQWYNASGAITGATSATYSAETPDTYYVIVKDGDDGCTVTSSNLEVTQDITDPTVSVSGAGELTCAVTSLTLTAVPVVDGTPSYQWYNASGAITGATSATYSAETPDTYYVIVKDGDDGCTVTSSNLEVTQDITDPTVSVSGAGELTCAVTSLTLTAVPVVDGTPSYQWYNASGAITGATSATYSAETPDTYYVIVKDGDDGCTVTSSNLEVTQDITDPTVSVSGAGELTCAVTSLTLTAVPVVDGTPSYQWYNASGAITGATSATYSAETPDTYYVIVKDGDDGCTVTSSNLEVTQDITDPTVSVSGAGELTCAVTSLTLTAVPVVDGTPSYQWYNASGAITGATSATYSAETPDTYYVIVKDGDDGCTVTSSNLEVTQDITDPTVSVSGAGELTCAVTSLTLTAVPVVDGTPSYQWYNASGAITGATSATYSAETPDTYYVIVKDGDDGCTVTSSNLEVTQDITDPTVSVSGAGELTCAVTSLTLTAVPVVDGTPSYQWYNASGAITGATSATYSAETPDTYYVIVKDGDDGCTVTSSNLEVTQDITDPTVSVSGAGELTCAVTSLTLTAVPVVDGTPSYQWYNASGAITGATSATYSAETPDTYYVIVKDGDDGCTVTSSNLEVTQDITDPTVSVSGAGELTCAVTSLTLTAVPVVDGTPSYQWYNASGAITGATSATYSAETPDTYYVIVKDGDDGCTVTSSNLEVTQDITDPTVSVSGAGELTCAVTSLTLTAVPVVDGTPSYQWYNASGAITGATSATYSAETPDTYYVIVKDGDDGCTVTSSNLEVTQDITDPTVSVSGAGELTCAVTSLTLTAVPVVDGTPSYQWYNASGAITGATSATYSAETPDTYYVIVKDGDDGCTVTSSNLEVTQDITDPTVSVSGAGELTCAVTSLTLTAVPVVDGTPSYQWYNASGAITGATSATYSAETPDTYYVIVKDGDDGCTVTSSNLEVTQDITDPTVSVSGAGELTCAVTSLTLTAVPVVDGTPSYQWYNASGAITGATSATYSAETPDTYYVIVKDGDDGCTVTSSNLEVTQDITDPTVSVSGAGELTCAVTSLTLTAVPVVDGTPSYQWYNASGAITGATSATYSAETPDTYYVIVKDGDDGCTVTSSNLEVTQDITDPTVSVSGAGELTCAVTSLTLTAVPVVDGTPSYQWYNASGAITGATSATYSAETPDTYYVIVKDGDDGCTVTSSNLEVTQDITDPTVSVSGAGELTCAVTSLTLTAVPVVDGTPSYQWYNASGAITGATSATYSAETPDTYYVIVKDGDDGCTVTSSNLEVTQDITDPTVSVSGAGELTCAVTSLTLTAVPVVDGTPSYQWYNASGAITGATSATYSAETPDTYYVIVKDGDDGCTVTSSNLEVTQDITDPTVSVSGAGELTCAVTSLTLTAVPVVDGTPSYQWYNASGAITGATSATYSAETPDTYYVIVKDGDDGCTVTSSNLEVTQDIVTPSADITGNEELTCALEEITLNANGNSDNQSAELSYAWSGPNNYTATTEEITVSSPGVYTVIVTDGDNGCSNEDSVTVLQDIVTPSADITGNEELTCALEEITLNANGNSDNQSAELSYAWSGPNNYTATTEEITVSSPGVYTVIVTDGDNGCSNEDSVTVLQDIVTPSADITGNEELTCALEEITLNANGNSDNQSAELSYAWSGPNNYTATTEEITVSVPGVYTVIVTDGDNGCSNEDSVTVLQDIVTPSADITGNEELTCALEEITLNANGNSDNQSAELSYAWSGPNNYTATTEEITVSSPGVYTVIVTDGDNGCSNEDSVTVLQDIVTPSADITGNEELTCALEEITLNANGNSDNQSAELSYAWSGPNNYTATTEEITVSVPGVYTVIVTDGDNGCSNEDSVTVLQDIVTPSADITGNEELTCALEEITLNANGNSDNQSAELSYAWSGPNNYTATTEEITVSSPGVYTVVVTDGDNGCSEEDSVTVLQDIVTPSVEITGNAELTCALEEITLNANGNSDNQSAELSYAWSGPNNYTATTEEITVSVPGVYTITITDGDNGCTMSDYVQVTQDNEKPIAIILTDTTVLSCGTTSVELDGSTSTSDARYIWSTGERTKKITVNEPGNYWLEVSYETNGCASYAFITVTEDIEKPVVTITGESELTCEITSVTLDASSSTVQGDASYLWSTGATTATIDVTEPGDYTVTVIDSVNGCSAISETFTVTQNITNVIAIITGESELTCEIKSVTLDASSSTVQGDASYLWSTGATTATIDVTEPGDYTVTVTDSENGCSAISETFTVTQNITNVIAIITGESELTCEITSVTLDASSSTVQGDASYLWSTGATTATIDVTEPGDYTVTVTDSVNGCSAISETFTVTQNITDVIAIITGESELTCEITSVMLDASSSTVQGDVSYLWSTGATTATIDVTELGDYTVTVTDSENGCSAISETFTVTQNITNVIAIITGESELTCEITSVTLDASSSTVQGEASYLWSTGATTATIDVTEPGDYTVTVTDSENGCSLTSEIFTVTQNITEVVAVITGGSELTCSIESVMLDASSSTVQGDASYLWSNGATSATIEVLEAGSYTVTVTDMDNGCAALSETFIVTEDFTAETIDNIDNVVILCIEDLEMDLTTLLVDDYESGGTWIDEFDSGGLTGDYFDPSIVNLGVYEFTYTEPGQCGRIIKVYLEVNDDCVVLPCSTTELEISKVVTPNNDGFNDQFEISGLEGCGFTFDVQIFNRWGKMVFQSSNYQNDWKGNFNTGGATIGSSTELPTGTYYYIVNVLSSGFEPITGYIYLGTN
ncbi:gliding motility-associated C-terminal domain-containing protein [Lutibacter sp. A80]|uniref:T9SS type B sorting domain-containing protein n=1 Tax=Lutibacter sp. A80 TaxID=2918453 RepID=UPI001F06127C|nr:gliding motility-associated C-terminal domain-containing protein [Lutibacter sp. A80]UMB60077.1 gliding motility-associated C-terminal domain-containing protein [Lutibacter sp. A80]